jgi:tetratricopeptide (TPR) repeat protein
VAPGLARIQSDLVDLAEEVTRLGELGRGALAALVASDFTVLDKAVADGQTLARAIESRSAAIREDVALLPGTGPNEALIWSPDVRARRDAAVRALNATGGLEAAWIRLAAGSTVANRLTVLLTDHDTIAGQAAASGRSGKYAAALKTLEAAAAKLDQAKALGDVLANTVDVTTLRQWVDRNREYDAALGHLYRATVAAKGRITADLKQAAVEERRAHELLPANTSGLVIILAEIGRGGLNQAVIGIEQTRAKLQKAVDALETGGDSERDAGGRSPEPAPPVSPTPSGA